jgi:hypothetical protein
VGGAGWFDGAQPTSSAAATASAAERFDTDPGTAIVTSPTAGSR